MRNPDMASLPNLRPLLFSGLEAIFVRQAEAAQDRDAVNFDTMTIRHLQHQII
jgi:hypothetical protein